MIAGRYATCCVVRDDKERIWLTNVNKAMAMVIHET